MVERAANRTFSHTSPNRWRSFYKGEGALSGDVPEEYLKLKIPLSEASFKSMLNRVSRQIDLRTKETPIVLSDDIVDDLMVRSQNYPLLKKEEEIMLGILRDTANENLSSKRRLSDEERQKWEARAQRVKEIFINSNLRLVVSVIRSYQGLGLSKEDLASEGMFGLIRGFEKFDWRMGFKFSTYGSWWVRQSVSRAIGNHSRNIRVPIHKHGELLRLHKEEWALHSELGRPPTDQELATSLNSSVEKIGELKAIADTISLETELTDDAVLGDALGQEDEMIEEIAMRLDYEKLHKAISMVENERAREALADHFGFNGTDPQTYEAIGKKLGVSRERVRQLTGEALREVSKRYKGLIGITPEKEYASSLVDLTDEALSLILIEGVREAGEAGILTSMLLAKNGLTKTLLGIERWRAIETLLFVDVRKTEEGPQARLVMRVKETAAS